MSYAYWAGDIGNSFDIEGSVVSSMTISTLKTGRILLNQFTLSTNQTNVTINNENIYTGTRGDASRWSEFSAVSNITIDLNSAHLSNARKIDATEFEGDHILLNQFKISTNQTNVTIDDENIYTGIRGDATQWSRYSALPDIDINLNRAYLYNARRIDATEFDGDTINVNEMLRARRNVELSANAENASFNGHVVDIGHTTITPTTSQPVLNINVQTLNTKVGVPLNSGGTYTNGRAYNLDVYAGEGIAVPFVGNTDSAININAHGSFTNFITPVVGLQEGGGAGKIHLNAYAPVLGTNLTNFGEITLNAGIVNVGNPTWTPIGETFHINQQALQSIEFIAGTVLAPNIASNVLGYSMFRCSGGVYISNTLGTPDQSVLHLKNIKSYETLLEKGDLLVRDRDYLNITGGADGLRLYGTSTIVGHSNNQLSIENVKEINFNFADSQTAIRDLNLLKFRGGQEAFIQNVNEIQSKNPLTISTFRLNVLTDSQSGIVVNANLPVEQFPYEAHITASTITVAEVYGSNFISSAIVNSQFANVKDWMSTSVLYADTINTRQINAQFSFVSVTETVCNQNICNSYTDNLVAENLIISTSATALTVPRIKSVVSGTFDPMSNTQSVLLKSDINLTYDMPEMIIPASDIYYTLDANWPVQPNIFLPFEQWANRFITIVEGIPNTQVEFYANMPPHNYPFPDDNEYSIQIRNASQSATLYINFDGNTFTIPPLQPGNGDRVSFSINRLRNTWIRSNLIPYLPPLQNNSLSVTQELGLATVTASDSLQINAGSTAINAGNFAINANQITINANSGISFNGSGGVSLMTPIIFNGSKSILASRGQVTYNFSGTQVAGTNMNVNFNVNESEYDAFLVEYTVNINHFWFLISGFSYNWSYQNGTYDLNMTCETNNANSENCTFRYCVMFVPKGIVTWI